ncbi:MAG: hypothetical protein JO224_04390 [Pelomonas sp.]|nr:hypothetical protein [Roseateles sp.]
MRLQELLGPGDEARVYEAWYDHVAALARRAGVLLRGVAIAFARQRRPGIPEIEFYAEAGAPEGALFVDGHRVGTLPGVNRL